jgi:hypothetical protein
MFPILPGRREGGHTAWMSELRGTRPGDRMLNRYAPGLSAEERDHAHERLRSLARVLIRINRRLAANDMHRDDSTHLGAEGRIPSL